MRRLKHRFGKYARKSGAKPGLQHPYGLEVTCHHMPDWSEQIVQDWFANRAAPSRTSGDRSIHIQRPGVEARELKIKGAGFRGGPIRFGKLLNRGPVFPQFDYDGRRMLDIASSHDGAYEGGASMQQAVTEWRVSRELETLGYDVVPCLGYGSVTDGTHRSWFSVFDWDTSWLDNLDPPNGSPEIYQDLALRSGELTLELAIKHDLIGFSWLVRDADGRKMLKDLHPFRRADEINVSRVSWVMQTVFALHINALAKSVFARNWYGEDALPDAPLWPLWAACPDYTRDEWDKLRFSLVAKFMITDPEDFSAESLQTRLETDRLTRRLLELCPEKFAGSP
ncbi:hypothetical protein [Pelagovum pacificum]|uniref:Uncharacterized protein n=1 Tax=Pelagovum pacificum TaxID=2588711 RepID=A0A5C5GD90_9RHOB|nr:hypothetical protein [Pelagovum pacificum]QQA44768.1 hypothetical protein I8N54_09440 [Pelagovum pacificum]TNY32124.1 hypothetical protein FHY64_02155 [Pelagovum pacificum]